MRLPSKNASNAKALYADDECIECLIQKKNPPSCAKKFLFKIKLLNKPKSTYLQKTTLKEGAGTKIIIWQYHPLPPCSSCLIREEMSSKEDRAGQLYFPVWWLLQLESVQGSCYQQALVTQGKFLCTTQVPAGHPLPTSL